jgi:hypothetical protein
MMLFQEIVKNMPKTLPTQAIEAELVPFKKGQSIESALFDVEDDVQNNPVRMTNYISISFRSICLVKFSNHKNNFLRI